MKIRFYANIWHGFNPATSHLFAYTSPGAKAAGTKRIMFEVDVPDSFIIPVDAVCAVGNVSEVQA
jgi:hypothetical protein